MTIRMEYIGDRFLSFFVLLSTVSADTFSLCYDCFGNTSDIGRYCSIDKLCEGAGCYFEARGNGRWVAGCIDSVQSGVSASFAMSQAQPAFSCSNAGDLTLCHCVGDLCNHVTHASHYLQNTYWKSLFVTNDTRPADPVLPPNLTVDCYECGMVQTSNGPWNITNCFNFCKGSYCMTRGGQYPHSFCGTAWEGESNPRCVVHPTEPQLCSCSGSHCNYMFAPVIPDSTTVSVFTTSSDGMITTTTTPQAIEEPSTTNTTSTATSTSTAFEEPSTTTTSTSTSTTTTTAFEEPSTTTTTSTKTGFGEPTTTPSTSTTTTTTSTATTTSTSTGSPGVTSSTSSSATTTGTAAPTTEGSTVGTTIPVNCINGQFTPNQQAVQIGEKIKNIIENGFQPQDMSDFNQAINNHICSYSSPSVGGKK